MLLLYAIMPMTQSIQQQSLGLTTGGWIFVTIAWTAIISIAVFCYRKVLQKAAEKRRRGLPEA